MMALKALAYVKTWMIVVATILFVGMSASDAQAQNITVGGTTYNINILPVNQSFNDNSAAIQATPWWGDATLAEDIANEYLNSIGTVNLSPSMFDFVSFAYEIATSGVVLNVFNLNESSSSVTMGSPSLTLALTNQAYATGTIVGTVAVPEINGAALAQVLFVLFALSVCLHLRRRRVD